MSDVWNIYKWTIAGNVDFSYNGKIREMLGNIVHPEAYTHSSKVGSKKYSVDVNVLAYCGGNIFAFYYEVLKKNYFTSLITILK